MAAVKKATKPRSVGRNRFPVALALRPDRDGQVEEWKEAAARAGMSLAAWARLELDHAARRGERE